MTKERGQELLKEVVMELKGIAWADMTKAERNIWIKLRDAGLI